MTPTHIELLLVPFDTARRGWRMGAGPHHLAARGLASALVTRGYSVITTAIDPGAGRSPTAEIATAFGLDAHLGRYGCGRPWIARGVPAGPERQLQYRGRDAQRPVRAIPAGVLVRRTRRLQYAGDHDDGFSRRDGTGDRVRLVLEGAGSEHPRIRSHRTARNAPPRDARRGRARGPAPGQRRDRLAGAPGTARRRARIRRSRGCRETQPRTCTSISTRSIRRRDRRTALRCQEASMSRRRPVSRTASPAQPHSPQPASPPTPPNAIGTIACAPPRSRSSKRFCPAPRGGADCSGRPFALSSLSPLAFLVPCALCLVPPAAQQPANLLADRWLRLAAARHARAGLPPSRPIADRTDRTGSRSPRRFDGTAACSPLHTPDTWDWSCRLQFKGRADGRRSADTAPGLLDRVSP